MKGKAHDCCSPGGGRCETPATAARRLPCPECGELASRVPRITVASLLRPEHAEAVGPDPLYFCPRPGCDTVYFGPEQTPIPRSMLQVRVGSKETEDPIPVCYCFEITRDSIRREIERRGRSDAVQAVRAEVAAGNCECETKNPSGKCCLGALTKAVQEAQGEVMR